MLKSCTSWFVGAVLLFVFLMIFVPGCFSIDSTTKLPIETKVFPDGEILTCESTRFQGFQGSSLRSQLYFQETTSSPREKIEGPFPTHPLSQAILIRQSGLTLGIIVGEQFFTHYIFHGEWRWEQLHKWPNNDATLGFLRSLIKSDYPDLDNFAGPSYSFDHFDVEHNLLITKRSSSDNQFPLFLVYSTINYNEPNSKPSSMLGGADWKFDLDRTRETNGLKSPAIPKLILDVEVTTRDQNLVGENPTSKPPIPMPQGRQLFTKSFPLVKDWIGIDYPTADAVNNQGGQITIGGIGGQTVQLSKHVEARFGFQDCLPDIVTICWRGKDYYGEQYQPVKLGAWDTVYTGGNVEKEVVYFRLRKPE
jgi:hypothetical protein